MATWTKHRALFAATRCSFVGTQFMNSAFAAADDVPSAIASKAPVGVVLGTNYEQWLRTNVPNGEADTYNLDATISRS